MKKERINLNRRLVGIIGFTVLLILSAWGWLDAQTYGNAWQQGNLTATLILRDVVFTGSRFVAVGDNGTVFRSTNGTSWSSVNSGQGISDHLFCVAFGNGIVVAAGRDGLIITSGDEGATWTTANPKGADGTEDIFGAAYGNNTFVVVGESGTFWTSATGDNWSKRSTGTLPRSIAFGDGWFMVGSSNGAIYRTYDGTTLSTVGNMGAAVRALAYGNSMWIAAGRKIATSSNGTSWTIRVTLSNYNIVDQLYSARIAPGSLIAAGEHGLMLNSSDGIVWRKGNSGTLRFIFGMAFGNNVVAAVGNGGPRDPNSLYLYSTHYSTEGGTPPPPLPPPSGNTIRITSPNGGETLIAGTKHTIKWNSTGSVGDVKLWLAVNDVYTKIEQTTANDGAYEWTVPNNPSTKCKIRISETLDGSVYDESDGFFSIESTDDSSLTIAAPQSNESLTVGTKYTIKWTSSGSVGDVKIWFAVDDVYTKIENATANDGSYEWTVPNNPSNQCKIRISDAADGYPYGESGNFSIGSPPTSWINVVSPNGGEVWAKGSTENITWTSHGEVGNVRIFYSTDNGFNWTAIISSTTNDGNYAWTLPDIITDGCLVKISAVSNAAISDVSNDVFIIGGPPQIVLNKTRFNFGYIKNGASPCGQTLFIHNGGGGNLNWTAEADASWINLTPPSGIGGGVVTIAIDTIGLNTGSYTGTITVNDPDVGNSPQTAVVYLTVKNGNQDEVPFGTFATPENGLNGVSGSIAVTGWVLDDTCVESLKIYRQVNGGLSFIGDAVFVEGARPDVEQAYPAHPNNYRAGWGYMMLTNFLPDGQLVLKAIATDTTGHQVELGTKTITVDNANAVKPFGAIDTPDQGGEASGTKFRNNGWALTPQPNKIPESGSTINVFIDGMLVDNVNYNLYRSDIANFFPGYANANGAWGYLDFDTTAYASGVHTIAWAVTDNAGNTDGIGSRYFSIQNTGGAYKSSAPGMLGMATAPGYPWQPGITPTKDIPVHDFGFIVVKRGYNQERRPQMILPNEAGAAALEVNELERIEIQLNKNISHGYLVVGNEFRPLPIGSTLVPGKGIFYWQPCAGFLGNYELIFIGKHENGKPFMKRIDLKINPKHFGK